MKPWIRYCAKLTGLTGACITLVVGVALHLTVPTLVVRSLVVGGALYLTVLILGRVVGEVILRLAIAQQAQRQPGSRPESEDGSAARADLGARERAKAA